VDAALLPETRSLDGKFDTVGAPFDQRVGSAQACETSAEIKPENVCWAAEERAIEQADETSAQSL
jgi:hypothetical protein